MSEVIAHLDHTVVDHSGRKYYVNVASEPTADGQWEAWLEFLPLDDTDPLLTDTETTQPTHSAVAHWAMTLGETYVQGAFERATPQDSVRIARAELLTIIERHDLNPARVSLARLSTSQVVTFIVTAAEAQMIQGRR